MTGDDESLLRTSERLAFVRDELRFELGLLHGRVGALIGAETFLTIAFTAAMSTGASWGDLVSPILAALGLALALLAWPGIHATVTIIMAWTARYVDLLSSPSLSSTPWGLRSDHVHRAATNQARSMLFFRAVPALLTVAWTAFLIISIVLRD